MEALIRMRALRAGDVVTVQRGHGAYTDLPAALKEGAQVIVKATGVGYARVLSFEGEEFELPLPQIDMPRDVWWHGRWIDRGTHPEGERAFRWAVSF